MSNRIDSISVHVDSLQHELHLISRLRCRVLEGKYSDFLSNSEQFVFKHSNYYLRPDGGFEEGFSAQSYSSVLQEELEIGVGNHDFQKFEGSGASWEVAWSDVQSQLQKITADECCDFERAFDEDWEFFIPSEYSEDEEWHCVLYISSHPLGYCECEKKVCQETIQRIAFYRDHKNDDSTDTFYHSHLNVIEGCILEKLKNLENTLALLSVTKPPRQLNSIKPSTSF